jgi:glutamyl-tRNA synthetase
MDDLSRVIRKYALKNAAEHGSARESTVLAKVLSVDPSLKKNMKTLAMQVASVVKEINAMDKDSLQRAYAEYEDEFEKEHSERAAKSAEHSFYVEGAVEGSFKTRFAPEPSGYMHIGHAKAAFIEKELARIYKGSVSLYFDDTNPAKERQEFVDSLKKDAKWLGISFSDEYYASDNIEYEYKCAEKLIKEGYAYACFCNADMIGEKRGEGKGCGHRNQTEDANLSFWKNMINGEYGENQVSLRFKGDMQALNTVMRDPVLFRIKKDVHYRQGDKYAAWPSYDFNTPIIDSIKGITHAARSKEYELRDELYYKLLDLLEMRKPSIIEFSRLKVANNMTSKRDTNKLIEDGLVSGYDDSRLVTISALRKRGITPEAIRDFALRSGMSKSESTSSMEELLALNRRIIDNSSKRLFFVREPVKLEVAGVDKIDVKLPLHPNAEIGFREYSCGSVYYIDRNDADALEIGSTARLKGAFNIKVTEINDNMIKAEYKGTEKVDALIMQWVSEGNLVQATLTLIGDLLKDDEFNRSSMMKVNGYVESYASKLKDNDTVQFERIGFFKFDAKEKTFFSL